MASGTQPKGGLTFNNYKIKEGAFHQFGKDIAKDTKFDYISGELDRIQFFDDPGNAAYNIDPYLGIRVSLRDGDTVEVFKIKLESPLGVSFAKRLHHVNKGDLVKLTLTTGSKNANASFISLRILDESTGEYILPEPAEWSTGSTDGMSKRDKFAFDDKRFQAERKVVEEHPAFYVPEEKADDEPEEAKAKARPAKKIDPDHDPFADE